MSMNPFDEIAVEEALKKREEGHVAEVVAISIGDKQYVIHQYSLNLMILII